jgi:hypothetical protein
MKRASGLYQSNWLLKHLLLFVYQRQSFLEVDLKSIHKNLTNMTFSNNPFHFAGMMPLISNEIGINVNTTMADLKQFSPKIAVQNAAKDKLHKNMHVKQVENGKEHAYKIAYPNDRGKSIGPFKRDENYK